MAEIADTVLQRCINSIKKIKTNKNSLNLFINQKFLYYKIQTKNSDDFITIPELVNENSKDFVLNPEELFEVYVRLMDYIKSIVEKDVNNYIVFNL